MHGREFETRAHNSESPVPQQFRLLEFLRKSEIIFFCQESHVKGDAKVLAVLQEVLKAELTAINQYFLHAEMCENWGFAKLADYVRKESIDEMKHAEKLMERILYLDGSPNMTDYFKINIGGTIEQQFKNDLQVE